MLTWVLWVPGKGPLQKPGQQQEHKDPTKLQPARQGTDT